MIRFCVHEFLIFCMFRLGLATIFSVCGSCTQRGKETPLHVYGQNIGGALSLKGILFDAHIYVFIIIMVTHVEM